MNVMRCSSPRCDYRNVATVFVTFHRTGAVWMRCACCIPPASADITVEPIDDEPQAPPAETRPACSR